MAHLHQQVLSLSSLPFPIPVSSLFSYNTSVHLLYNYFSILKVLRIRSRTKALMRKARNGQWEPKIMIKIPASRDVEETKARNKDNEKEIVDKGMEVWEFLFIFSFKLESQLKYFLLIGCRNCFIGIFRKIMTFFYTHAFGYNL
uniref:Transmembrane protein n=1 Tax=Heterorhabditis bacteriophora TaxID=37862 RepID=A0A1I7W8W4_HETBA